MNLPGASVARALVSRAGSSAMIFVVAVVAVAAAAAGPTYYGAARTSILRDTVDQASLTGRGFEVTESGPVAGTIGSLASEVSDIVGSGLGPQGRSTESRVLEPPIETVEANAFDSSQRQSIPLDWRSDFCAHLVIAGQCPTQTGQVIVSKSLATAFGFTTGQRLMFPTWGTLTITGIYTPPTGGDYWYTNLTTYFPAEFQPGGSLSHGPALPSVDALFTVRATLEAAPSTAQETDAIDDLLSTTGLRASDVTPLENSINGLLNNVALEQSQAIPTSEIPNTMGSVTSAWSSLALPVVVISAQLLGLAWLMLLLLVTEQAEARGPEVALAKLRGHSRIRTLGFGLSEPVALMAVALPVGALVGWAATVFLGHDLLRPGTPVSLSGLSWATAAAAVAAGLAAVFVASRRMLRRPVVEQWRRAGLRAADRGWVIDGILLTAAALGLIDLLATGSVSSAHKDALALLVPGILGLAVAVVASRLLPPACRALTTGGRSVGGLGPYLALRQVARRPGGARTTIMLATSFSIVTFAIAAWAVNDHNDSTVASAQVGASTVLDVAIPQGTQLGALVARADPSGHEAAPVEEYSSNGVTTMAVDPVRWSRVANWPGTKPADLNRLLAPPSPAPVVLDGTAVKVNMLVKNVSPPGSTLILDVDSPAASAPTPVELGTPPSSGSFTVTADLVGCPCLLQDLTVEPPPSDFSSGPSASGQIVLTAIEVATGDTRWRPAPAGLDNAGRWQTQGGPGSLTADPGGLSWSFSSPGDGGASAVLAAVDHPSPLPAVAATAVTGGKTGPRTVPGLDGNDLNVDVKSAVPDVPGDPATGVLVDLNDAYLAAAGFLSGQASPQVWVVAGSGGKVTARLRQLGVQVLSTSTESGTKAVLGRQGPGLARVLFLTEAGAAAALAAGGAILGLYLFARRRRYEYAALAVSGLGSRTLLASLVTEQLVVIGFGVLIGIGTGLASVAVALRAVPEFLTPPAAPSLSYLPPLGELAGLLAILVAAVVAGSVAASVAMVRSIRLDQLREAPA